MNKYSFHLYRYQMLMSDGKMREGSLLEINNPNGSIGVGEVSPLPGWSKETLDQAINQLVWLKTHVKNLDSLEDFEKIDLLPSVLFGINSAYSQCESSSPISIDVCSFLRGTPLEILEQALQSEESGFSFAKLKVGSLSLHKAYDLIIKLKDRFRLRIDVNKSWNTEDSLSFFSEFPKDAFDYVEEPLQNLERLEQFPIPFTIDESFSEHLPYPLPNLKGVIFKPTIRGWLSNFSLIKKWVKEKNIDLVLGSTFESDVGLAGIVHLANQLGVKSPLGIGTYRNMTTQFLDNPMIFSKGKVSFSGSSRIDKSKKKLVQIF